LRARIKEAMQLKTDQLVETERRNYLKALDALHAAGTRRVDLQAHLLTSAVAWGLPDAVWKYIRRGTKPEDLAAADNLFFTDLPGLLAETYQAQKLVDQYKLVTVAWQQLAEKRPLKRPMIAQLEEILHGDSDSRFKDAAQLIKQGSPAEQDRWAFRLV